MAMMTVENGVVAFISGNNDVVGNFYPYIEGVAVGDTLTSEQMATIGYVMPEIKAITKVSPIEFKLLFTSGERIAIKSSTDPVVQDFYEITNDPRLTHVDLGLKSTQDAIAHLVHVGILTQARADAILTGAPV